MSAYYNEIDHAAAHVLRTLIDLGVIAPGEVDTRSIKDVHPDDLKGFTQCHFFAGGGLWSVAARLAGWPDERPLWTASCPCQPFSVAGQGAGIDDPRHLWPDAFRLIRARRPALVVGEQVAGKAGYGWFDGVAADLESEGYTCRAVDIPACAVDAPHIRSRLYWCAVADSAGSGRDAGAFPGIHRQAQGDGSRHGEPERLPGADGALEHSASIGRGEGQSEPEFRGGRGALADADAQIALGNILGAGLEGQRGHGDGRGGWHGQARPATAPDGGDSLHADADRSGCAGRQESQIGSAVERAVAEWDLPWRNGSFWSDHEWIICHDGKARRTKPGLRLLVDGVPGRVDLWRIGGNAIVPQIAAEVLASLMDVLDGGRGAA